MTVRRITGGFEVRAFGWSLVFILTRVIGLIYASRTGSLNGAAWSLPLYPRKGRP